MPVKILVPDGLSRSGLELLTAHSDWVVLDAPDLPADRFEAEMRDADAVVVRSKTRVTRRLLEASPRLRAVGRAGAGVDNIDVEACTARGIPVINTPGGNSISAAEHTVALLLALARNIPQADASLRKGEWLRARFEGLELQGKTLGVVGLGKIGREVARRARALGMRVMAFDPYVSEKVAREQGIVLASLEELLTSADAVSLHAPLNSTTRQFINSERLAMMKPGALLVNAARGELVDEEALHAALIQGRLAGAALDVFCNEPPGDSPLLGLANVIATPHIAASTREAQEKVGLEIARSLADYLTRGIILNAVNFPTMNMEEYARLRPYLELGERLGRFVSQISTGRMEMLGVRYYGELAERDPAPITNAVLFGLLRPILSEQVTPVNAPLVAAERGLEIVESRSTRVRRYSNVISVRLTAGARTEWVEGTLVHRDRHCLCSVDGIHIEAPLERTLIFCRNRDLPGVIGQVGTLLGNSQINIANFALGRDAATSQAVAVVNVDSREIPAAVLERLRSIAAISFAQAIHLPEPQSPA